MSVLGWRARAPPQQASRCTRWPARPAPHGPRRRVARPGGATCIIPARQAGVAAPATASSLRFGGRDFAEIVPSQPTYRGRSRMKLLHTLRWTLPVSTRGRPGGRAPLGARVLADEWAGQFWSPLSRVALSNLNATDVFARAAGREPLGRVAASILPTAPPPFPASVRPARVRLWSLVAVSDAVVRAHGRVTPARRAGAAAVRPLCEALPQTQSPQPRPGRGAVARCSGALRCPNVRPSKRRRKWHPAGWVPFACLH